MNNVDLQNEEIFALKSIYDEKELIVEHDSPPRGRFIANVLLQSPFYVCCGESDISKYEVEYLPPINLFFEFPETYPSSTCPAFLLSCSWLSLEQLSGLCKKLESLWCENCGEVVLFRWIDFLISEVLNFLHITDTLDITKLSLYRFRPRSGKPNIHQPEAGKSSESSEENRTCKKSEEDDGNVQVLDIKPSVCGGFGSFDCRAHLDLTNGSILLPLLLRYDRSRKSEAFSNSWVTCDICYSTKKGSDFLKFNKCDHAYCKECLTSYFEVQIKEGNVHALNCPTDKCDSQADAEEVKQLVTPELFQKYDTILLSRSLESMEDVVYCPRKACQSPLITDPSSNMGCCPACSYVFCLYCRMAYHGVAPCSLKYEERKELAMKFLEGDSDEKIRLEKQYGKKELKLIVDNVLSEDWVTTNSKQCPHCHTSIEKTEGCNKMTCFKCGTFFCWLCMARLNQTNPYSHYSNVSVPCYNQLFPQEEIDFEPGEFLEWL